MTPNFSKTTITLLAQRAAYLCSNPDCKILTIAPNTDGEKIILIGQAAHVYGARKGSKRYNIQMTDDERSNISNGIWLCNNCHKLIDSDDKKYTAEKLFQWKNDHEKFVSNNLGEKSHVVNDDAVDNIFCEIENCPQNIKKIVIEKQEGWEYLLTSSLLVHYNTPIIRKLEDLYNCLYTKEIKHLSSENILLFISESINELQMILVPFSKIFDVLNKSWGLPGCQGDPIEIVHAVKLISSLLKRILHFEEKIRFITYPIEYYDLIILLQSAMKNNVSKMQRVPDQIYRIYELIQVEDQIKDRNLPLIINDEIVFNLPRNWESNFEKLLCKLNVEYKLDN